MSNQEDRGETILRTVLDTKETMGEVKADTQTIKLDLGDIKGTLKDHETRIVANETRWKFVKWIGAPLAVGSGIAAWAIRFWNG